MKSVPYASALTCAKARDEITSVLRRFGCESVGFMDDFQKHEVLLAFVHRGRQVQLRASASGWARMYLDANPWTYLRRSTQHEWEQAALRQGHVPAAPCSNMPTTCWRLRGQHHQAGRSTMTSDIARIDKIKTGTAEVAAALQSDTNAGGNASGAPMTSAGIIVGTPTIGTPSLVSMRPAAVREAFIRWREQRYNSEHCEAAFRGSP
jgi:hypothetical protein